uniref:Uncharacterized protein n=1 Tax=virus sp. ctrcb4 TaxID=2825824 RepID=A0A8S5RP29_9VIRU|nr:MAG TPA: hypothetical protein [virus sp. ctrcb4]
MSSSYSSVVEENVELLTCKCSINPSIHSSPEISWY